MTSPSAARRGAGDTANGFRLFHCLCQLLHARSAADWRWFPRSSGCRRTPRKLDSGQGGDRFAHAAGGKAEQRVGADGALGLVSRMEQRVNDFINVLLKPKFLMTL